MEKDNKRKVSPEINEELMMNLMVDGIKKDGLQLPPEPTQELQKKDNKPKVVPTGKQAIKEKAKIKKQDELAYESIFFQKNRYERP